MTNLGIFYFDISDYIKKNLTGFSELRFKIDKDKDNKYKKEIEGKYNELSLIDKCIYKMVLLPKTPFTNILKYLLEIK